MSYRPQKSPEEMPEYLKRYLSTELSDIATSQENAEVSVVSYRVWATLPPKLRTGDVFYGATDVGVVGAEGLRQVKSTGIVLL